MSFTAEARRARRYIPWFRQRLALKQNVKVIAGGRREDIPNRVQRRQVNAAFLIERSAMAQFDGAVQAASDRYGSDIEFKLVGPMPPYSFVDRAWESTDTGELQPAWA